MVMEIINGVWNGNGARLLHRTFDTDRGALPMGLRVKASQQFNGNQDWRSRLPIRDSGGVRWEASDGRFPKGTCQRRKAEVGHLSSRPLPFRLSPVGPERLMADGQSVSALPW